MSISMSIGTPTLIAISTAAITHSNGRRVVRAMLGSTTLNTAKASRIETRARRKNSIGQAHRTRLSRVRIFAGEATPAGRTSGAAARAIAEEQVTAAAPAKLAVATGREQRIVVGRARSAAERIAAELEVAAEQANSAVVVEQIEAALEAAAAPFKASSGGGSQARSASQRGSASRVERRRWRSQRRRWWRWKIWRRRWRWSQAVMRMLTVFEMSYVSPSWNSPRHPTLDTRISFDGGRNEISKQRNENVQVCKDFVFRRAQYS